MNFMKLNFLLKSITPFPLIGLRRRFGSPDYLLVKIAIRSSSAPYTARDTINKYLRMKMDAIADWLCH
jgi:hypothetical protein